MTPVMLSVSAFSFYYRTPFSEYNTVNVTILQNNPFQWGIECDQSRPGDALVISDRNLSYLGVTSNSELWKRISTNKFPGSEITGKGSFIQEQ